MRKGIQNDLARANHKATLGDELDYTCNATDMDPASVKRLLRTMTHSEIRSRFWIFTTRFDA